MILTIQLFLQGKLHMSEVDPELPAPDGEEGDVLRVETLGESQYQGVLPPHCTTVNNFNTTEDSPEFLSTPCSFISCWKCVLKS